MRLRQSEHTRGTIGSQRKCRQGVQAGKDLQEDELRDRGKPDGGVDRDLGDWVG